MDYEMGTKVGTEMVLEVRLIVVLLLFLGHISHYHLPGLSAHKNKTKREAEGRRHVPLAIST